MKTIKDYLSETKLNTSKLSKLDSNTKKFISDLVKELDYHDSFPPEDRGEIKDDIVEIINKYLSKVK